jgi:predicted AAA+ superfamily ATPase
LPEIKGKILNYLDQYLKTGGFPEIVVKNLDPKTYLETLFDAVLFKDVVKRYKIRLSQKIYDLVLYLISNFSGEFSFTKLKKVLGFLSVNTIENYLKYLQEAYLIFILNRFSFKTKEQIKTPKKIYLIDNGFILTKSFQFSQNIGKLMENLVFVEILRRGFKLNQDVFYYQTRKQKEIDFVLKQGPKIKQLIQVCYNIEDFVTKEREIKGLISASRELNCDDLLVISWDLEEKEKVRGKKIKILPLWKWLLK